MTLRRNIWLAPLILFFSAVMAGLVYIAAVGFFDAVSQVISGGQNFIWGEFLLGPFAFIFFFVLLGFIRTLFLNIGVDKERRLLFLPYWPRVDRKMLNDYVDSGMNKNLLFAYNLFAKKRSFSLSDIASILIVPQSQVAHFLPYYGHNRDAQQKIIDYLQLYDPSAQLKRSIMMTAGMSVGKNPAEFLTAAAVGTVALKFGTEPSILILETREELVIKDLSAFLQSDPPYLQEYLRTLGVNILAPKIEPVATDVQKGTLYPSRKITVRSLLPAIVLVILMIIFIWQIYTQ